MLFSLANQNDIEILPHSSQNGYHQNYNKNASEDMGQRNPLYTVGGNVN
jgi:hypothetical protein